MAGSVLDQDDGIDNIIKQNQQKLVDRENISDNGSAYNANRSQGSAAKSRHSGIAAGIGQLSAPMDKIRVNDQKESTITKNEPKPFDAYLQGATLPEANKTT